MSCLGQIVHSGKGVEQRGFASTARPDDADKKLTIKTLFKLADQAQCLMALFFQGCPGPPQRGRVN